MPIYEYTCTECKTKFELLRSISQIDEPAECPKCKAEAKRAVTSFLCRSAASGGGGDTESIGGGGSCASCSSTSCSGCSSCGGC